MKNRLLAAFICFVAASGGAMASDATVLEGTTRGSRPKPYQQSIRLQQDNKGLFRPVGYCTCPVSFNCS